MVSEEGSPVSPTRLPGSLKTEGSYRCDDFIINPYPLKWTGASITLRQATGHQMSECKGKKAISCQP